MSPDPSLAPIDQSYWRKAVFTYDFFGKDRSHDFHAETKPVSAGPAYRDVRFNGSEVTAFWPKSQSDNRIFAAKAAYLIVTQSEWAKNLAQRPDSMPAAGWHDNSMDKKEATRRRLVKAFHRDLHDRLRAGEIAVWARKDRHYPLEPIKVEEWGRIHISMEDIDFKNLENGFCAPININIGTGRTTCYENVKFSKTDIFKAYPLLTEPFSSDLWER